MNDDTLKTISILENITNISKYLLQNNANREVQEYLDSRISREVQNVFNFGYYPSIENLSVLTSLIDKEDLKTVKLLFSKEIEDSLFPRTVNFSYFENYPMILPFKDQYGRIRGIVGRTLLSEQQRKLLSISKYKNTKPFTKSKYLFGLFENKQEIINKGFVYLVEGQFDVIKCYEHNIKNVVAIGSCNLSNTQLSLIKRYTNNLFVLFDNDDAGIIGRNRIIEKYAKYSNIKNAYVPTKFKDVDEYLKSLNGKSPEITVQL